MKIKNIVIPFLFISILGSCGNWKTKMIEEYSNVANYIGCVVEITNFNVTETVCYIGFNSISYMDRNLIGGFITKDMYDISINNGFDFSGKSKTFIRICPHIYFDGGSFPICSLESVDRKEIYLPSEYGLISIREWAKKVK
ncbi:MAG: hypothetical protein MJ248_04440 [Bacilli bacterium]|nr:hypothetical protein [Bacilli bacterium]